MGDIFINFAYSNSIFIPALFWGPIGLYDFFHVMVLGLFCIFHRFEMAYVRRSKYVYGWTGTFTLIGHMMSFLPIMLVAVLFLKVEFRVESIYVCFSALISLRRTLFTFFMRSFQTSGECMATIKRLMVR